VCCSRRGRRLPLVPFVVAESLQSLEQQAQRRGSRNKRTRRRTTTTEE
jgi:hypothetical protein